MACCKDDWMDCEECRIGTGCSVSRAAAAAAGLSAKLLPLSPELLPPPVYVDPELDLAILDAIVDRCWYFDEDEGIPEEPMTLKCNEWPWAHLAEHLVRKGLLAPAGDGLFRYVKSPPDLAAMLIEACALLGTAADTSVCPPYMVRRIQDFLQVASAANKDKSEESTCNTPQT